MRRARPPCRAAVARRRLHPGRTAALLALCSLAACSPLRAQQPLPADATLPDVDGKPLRLAQLSGRPLVLNFWAFWCDTWKAEMPHLRELAAAQQELGFALVAVSVDGTRVVEYRKDAPAGAPFPVLLDVGGKLSERFAVRQVPTVMVLDARGAVRYRHIGYPGTEVLRRELRALGRADGTKSAAGG